MNDYENAYVHWRSQQVSKHKALLIDQVYEKTSGDGTTFVQQKAVRKESFGHLPDSDEDEPPTIRAGFALNKSAEKNLLAKIVFYRDTDVLQHPFEQLAGRWASFFSNKLAQFCATRPRFSELRPMRFMHD
jgi:hypothetical protein